MTSPLKEKERTIDGSPLKFDSLFTSTSCTNSNIDKSSLQFKVIKPHDNLSVMEKLVDATTNTQAINARHSQLLYINKSSMKTSIIIPFLILSISISCTLNDDDKEPIICDQNDILESFTTPDNDDIFIYQNGKAYINDGDICTFILQYFDPNFLQKNYVTNDSGTFILVGDEGLYPTKNNFFENFENYNVFTDLFISAITDTNLYWSSFTLQSPATPDVTSYTSLKKCILEKTCTFIDNKIEIVSDPKDGSNKVLKFTSVAPSAGMITAKSSLSSSINYFNKGSEVWFEADFFIESGIPFSLVDFENEYFSQHPGPRAVIRNNKIEFENKFGSKLNFNNKSDITVDQNEWFTLKIHLIYSNEEDGLIELWQNGIPIIKTSGINLPTSNSIQNILEVGISATSEETILLLDNLRISETPF